MEHSVVVFGVDSLSRIHEESFATAQEAYIRYCEIIELISEIGFPGKTYKVTRWVEDRLQAYEDVNAPTDDEFPMERIAPVEKMELPF